MYEIYIQIYLFFILSIYECVSFGTIVLCWGSVNSTENNSLTACGSRRCAALPLFAYVPAHCVDDNKVELNIHCRQQEKRIGVCIIEVIYIIKKCPMSWWGKADKRDLKIASLDYGMKHVSRLVLQCFSPLRGNRSDKPEEHRHKRGGEVLHYHRSGQSIE